MLLPDFEVTDTADPALGAMLLDSILDFNAAVAGPPDGRPLSVVVRDPATGGVRGGITGRTRYGWMFVEIFWLPEDLRGGGLGATLLAAAEREARARGCIGAWLDTMSFQAPGFYEKQGYTCFGVLPDYPPGHSKSFYMKRFDGGA